MSGPSRIRSHPTRDHHHDHGGQALKITGTALHAFVIVNDQTLQRMFELAGADPQPGFLTAFRAVGCLQRDPGSRDQAGPAGDVDGGALVLTLTLLITAAATKSVWAQKKPARP